MFGGGEGVISSIAKKQPTKEELFKNDTAETYNSIKHTDDANVREDIKIVKPPTSAKSWPKTATK